MTRQNTRDDVIVDPRAFIRSVPPSSPLLALVDAFDAAANGMINAEAASRLSDAEEESFRPWKALVSAIRAFYDDDGAAVIDTIDRISDSSPPAVLKPLFRAWALSPDVPAAQSLKNASAAVAALYQRLFSQTHPAAALAEQAEEALRQGMVDHFEALACKVMRELQESARIDGPLLALRYVERCLALLDESDEEDGAFFEAVIKNLGRADGFASLALALIGRDDAAAAAAFRRALEAPSHRLFFEGDLRAVAAAAAAILEGGLRDTNKHQGRTRKTRAKQAVAGQLELFPAEAV